MATEKVRTQIVDAMMALAAERPFAGIGLSDIAERAGLGLDAVRGAFASRIEILSAFIGGIDRAALAGQVETTEESVRERVFDILMRRFDALAAYRAGLKSILTSARSDLGLAIALNAIGIRSMAWMLEAADAARTGLRGAMRAQGLALIWARALRVWLEGDAADLDKTMAALDRALTQGERAVHFVERAADCAKAPMRKPRAARGAGEEVAA